MLGWMIVEWLCSPALTIQTRSVQLDVWARAKSPRLSCVLPVGRLGPDLPGCRSPLCDAYGPRPRARRA
jgi:hypothetical protein